MRAINSFSCSTIAAMNLKSSPHGHPWCESGHAERLQEFYTFQERIMVNSAPLEGRNFAHARSFRNPLPANEIPRTMDLFSLGLPASKRAGSQINGNFLTHVVLIRQDSSEK